MSAQPHVLSQSDLDRDGFAVIRGLVDDVTLRRMQRGFDRLYAIGRGLQRSTTVHNTRFVIRPEPFALERAVWCSGAAPELQLGHHAPTLDLVCDVLGTEAPVQIIQQAHFKMPGDGVTFRWHQDASNRRYGSHQWNDVDGRGSFLQIAVAVDPIGADNGGLSFLPGTHRLGFVADPVTGALPPESVDESTALTPELEPGDAVIFGPFVIHGSAANQSGTSRRTFLQGFACPGANAHTYPGCGTGVTRIRR